MGTIISINCSEKKGTVKTPVAEAEVRTDWGIVGDAHAGHWHRQISLLSLESFQQFQADSGCQLEFGAFGENLLIQGLPLDALKVGDRLSSGSCCLEITQIGKECHRSCAIRQRVGKCIMPQKGIFAKVLRGGIIRKGDSICIESV